jgi:hypothetical protein
MAKTSQVSRPRTPLGRIVMFFSLLPLLSALLSIQAVVGASAGWHFLQNGTSGILALEAMVVSPTLIIMFDRATNDPLQINNHTAWGALWNLEKHIATPLNMTSDSFCASGSFLSNGTMVRFSNLNSYH